jgi:nitroreductase
MTVADGLNPGVHEYIDSFIMATVDASLASQNATVAAESIGLGTVYIGATRNKAKSWPSLFNSFTQLRGMRAGCRMARSEKQRKYPSAPAAECSCPS